MEASDGEWAERVKACYDGAPSLTEARRLAAHVMAASSRVKSGGAGEMAPLHEKEEVMRRSAVKLGVPAGKLGIGRLQKQLKARGQGGLSSQVASSTPLGDWSHTRVA